MTPASDEPEDGAATALLHLGRIPDSSKARGDPAAQQASVDQVHRRWIFDHRHGLLVNDGIFSKPDKQAANQRCLGRRHMVGERSDVGTTKRRTVCRAKSNQPHDKHI